MPFFFFKLVTQGRAGGEEGGWAAASSASFLYHWSASFLRVNEIPEAKSLKQNGSWIQTQSLIKQWINVNNWRHAFNEDHVGLWRLELSSAETQALRGYELGGGREKSSTISIKEVSQGRLTCIFRYFPHLSIFSEVLFCPYRSLYLKFEDTKYGKNVFNGLWWKHDVDAVIHSLLSRQTDRQIDGYIAR